jgi:hypothetical protein
MTATKERAKLVSEALTSEVNAVLITRAHAEVMREKIDKVHAEIIDDLDIRDDDGNPIAEPRWYWRMADKYTAEYYAECDRRNREMGYDLEPGFCPALIAEDLQRKAEHNLIAAAAEFFGPSFTVNNLLCCRNGLEKLREAIDLLCKLVINAPGYRKPRI